MSDVRRGVTLDRQGFQIPDVDPLPCAVIFGLQGERKRRGDHAQYPWRFERRYPSECGYGQSLNTLRMREAPRAKPSAE